MSPFSISWLINFIKSSKISYTAHFFLVTEYTILKTSLEPCNFFLFFIYCSVIIVFCDLGNNLSLFQHHHYWLLSLNGSFVFVTVYSSCKCVCSSCKWNVASFFNIHHPFFNIPAIFCNASLYQNYYSKVSPCVPYFLPFNFPQQPSIWPLYHKGTWCFKIFLKIE